MTTNIYLVCGFTKSGKDEWYNYFQKSRSDSGYPIGDFQQGCIQRNVDTIDLATGAHVSRLTMMLIRLANFLKIRENPRWDILNRYAIFMNWIWKYLCHQHIYLRDLMDVYSDKKRITKIRF